MADDDRTRGRDGSSNRQYAPPSPLRSFRAAAHPASVSVTGFAGDLKVPGQPVVLLQAAIVDARGEAEEGQLIVSVSDVWHRILREIQRDPAFLSEFAKQHRSFEEFIAATYDETDEWDEVVLTPRSGDGGRDVIVTKHGVGALRFLEQAKAYSPGHLVTHNDVRAMLGVLGRDLAASKGIITTTSDFEPGALAGPEFAPYMPTRLQVRNGEQLIAWLNEIEARKEGNS